MNKSKLIIRNVYGGESKPYIIVNNKKIFIKNKKEIYGPKYHRQIRYLTTNLNAREM